MNILKEILFLLTATFSYCLSISLFSGRNKIFYLLLIFSGLLYSCKRSQEQQNILESNGPKVVEAHGYMVPKDSMAEPKVIPVGKLRIVPAGKPKVVPANINVHPAGVSKIVVAGVPRVCTPGQDSFSLPKAIPAIGNQVLAGIPNAVTAKEAYTREQNPKNLSSFGKLQGLKNEVVFCLFQDQYGNLWFGTQGGGATKYDGKNFTHFTEQEGLGNNFIRTILEDNNGNLWFGTWDEGVSKYDGRSFTRFTEKEGLCNDTVLSMVKDKSGNLWFGTMGGVSKYDGKSFTHFTVKEGLSKNEVRSILEDKSGKLWFGTWGGGVSKYDGKSFTHFTKKEGLSNDSVFSILEEDKDGRLWFGTEGGVSKYDGKSFTQFNEKQGLLNNSVTTILEDKSGDLWFGTFGGGVSKYDPDEDGTGGKTFTHLTEKEGLSSNVVYKVLEDKYGNLWFGTEGGISKYDPGSFTHFTEKEGLSGNNVGNIIEDKSGNLWFGTYKNGVNKYDGKTFTHFTVNEGLLSKNGWAMLEDKEGHLWFGGYEGVSKYDGKSFTYFTEKEGLINNDIKYIFQDTRGDLWFGGAGGVSKYDGKSFTQFTKKEGLSTNNVMGMLEDKRGHLWFCGYWGGVSKYDGKNFVHFTKKEGLSHNNVKCMLEDKTGNLWFGTLGGGVCKYDGQSFSIFTEKAGLSNNDITSMLLDKSGNLWLGTRSGLNKLEKDKLTSYTKGAVPSTDKLTDSYVNDKTTKRQSTTTDGLAKKTTLNLSESEHFFKTYTYEEGFSGVGVNHGKSIFEAKDGTIWIGGNDRLTAFNPRMETNDTIPPNIQITGIALFNENIAWQNLMALTASNTSNIKIKDTSIVLGNGMRFHDFHFDSISKWYGLPENLSLAHNNNFLTFQFVGITLQSPKKVKYQYQLAGLDENWSALTSRSEATYGNLPHGEYTFKVKAMNSDGYWSKEFNYSFTIRPPWWQTWWAYTLLALVFAGFIYALFRYRLNKIRMQHEIVLQQHKASELEMQALRAQMNPHFIFNCLSSINMFILENNKLQASEYLSKFSRLVRLILQNSQEAFIPLDRELEALRLYLELESLRFEQRFQYKISVNNEMDTTMVKVPPLIIQPYAENAIWHGLMHKKEKGNLEIELYLEKEILFCKITDDGIGRKKATELKSKSSLTYKSMGMRITADRIAILQQQEQNNSFLSVNDLVLSDGSPGGTEVLIKLPLHYD